MSPGLERLQVANGQILDPRTEPNPIHAGQRGKLCLKEAK